MQQRNNGDKRITNKKKFCFLEIEEILHKNQTLRNNVTTKKIFYNVKEIK